MAPSDAPVEDLAVLVDRVLRPHEQVLALAELEGSPYVVAGDSRGFLSAWHACLEESVENSLTVADHYHEAHASAVTCISMLRCPRLAEAVEEREIAEGCAELALETSAATVSRRCCGWMRKKSAPSVIPQEGRRTAVRHWLVASGAAEGAVRFWRWSLDPTLRRARHRGCCPMVFTVDPLGEWISEAQKPVSRLLEVHDGHIAVLLQEHPDILLVDPVTLTLKVVLYGHIGPIGALVESNDGRLVSGGHDGSVRLWLKRAWAPPAAAPVLLSSKGHLAAASPKSAWEDLGKMQLPARGVSSAAWYAHARQVPKAECVNMCLRVLVDRAENLPHADVFTEPDPYVTCSVVECAPGQSTARTPSTSSTNWQHCCDVELRKWLIDAKWQLPESLWLDIEVFVEGLLPPFAETLFAHHSIQVAEVLKEAVPWNASSEGNGGRGRKLSREKTRDQKLAGHVKPRKLYAPLGEGPYMDLKNAMLKVAFGLCADDPDTLSCFIQGAQGVHVGMASKAFARVTVRHTRAHTTVRRVPARFTHKTRHRMNSPHPVFNETLELEVPANLLDRRVVYSPDLHLQLDVWDKDDMKSDDLLATVTVPLSQVLALDEKGVHPYRLDLAQGMKFRSPKDGLRNSAAEGVISKEDVSKPRLYLAFQTIIPCPVQLKSVVETAAAIPPCITSSGTPHVRLRVVRGDPMLPRLTAVRTATCANTRSPAWNERCILPLPESLQFYDGSNRKPGQRHHLGSVRAGWQHPANELDVALCVDIYHKMASGREDIRLCRGSVPLEEALDFASESPGEPQAVPLSADAIVYLTFELGPEADQLTVVVSNAENVPGPDVMSTMGTDARSCSDPYCILQLAELGCFGDPCDDTARLNSLASLVTSTASLPSARDPEWHHEGLLELPGAQRSALVVTQCGDNRVNGEWYEDGGYDGRPRYVRDGDKSAVIVWSNKFEEWRLHVDGDVLYRSQVQSAALPTTEWAKYDGKDPVPQFRFERPYVAARPNCHLLFEVLDHDAETKEPILLAQAATPLQELLSELAEGGDGGCPQLPALAASRAGSVASSVAASALNSERSTYSTVTSVSGTSLASGLSVATSCTSRSTARKIGSLRETAKAVAKSADGMLSTLKEDEELGPPEITKEFALVPKKGIRRGVPMGTSQSQFKGDSTCGTQCTAIVAASQQVAIHHSQQAHQLAMTLTNGWARSTFSSTGFGNKKSLLVVRFEPVSRWKGDGRSAKRPKAKPTSGPSPVTCLTALVSSVIAGHANGNVCIWDTTGCSLLPLHHFEAHKVAISSLAYVPMLDCLVSTATGSDPDETAKDATLRIWDCSTMECRQTLPLHNASARCMQSLRLPGAKDAPCLVLGCDTRNFNQLQLLKVGGRHFLSATHSLY
eukprot:TRINITY_DN59479_c0_g1_i1.p1 TRINITY_DN59479_c0_g1~~TRINITY_DN59479_c0_g1_i1.p1  ORF type:complete len:1387 (-),score=262.46 TRINITY_DN59479_c0_g1_i1:97-4257(-)